MHLADDSAARRIVAGLQGGRGSTVADSPVHRSSPVCLVDRVLRFHHDDPTPPRERCSEELETPLVSAAHLILSVRPLHFL